MPNSEKYHKAEATMPHSVCNWASLKVTQLFGTVRVNPAFWPASI